MTVYQIIDTGKIDKSQTYYSQVAEDLKVKCQVPPTEIPSMNDAYMMSLAKFINSSRPGVVISALT